MNLSACRIVGRIKENARYLKEHRVDQGKVGRASGEGLYNY
jgi:hypothetical protein